MQYSIKKQVEGKDIPLTNSNNNILLIITFDKSTNEYVKKRKPNYNLRIFVYFCISLRNLVK